MFRSALILLSLTLLSWHSQDTNELRNTKWEGIMNVPNPTGVILAFDSTNNLDILLDGNSIETTAYTLKKDTISFKKITGESPCGEETGNYKYAIKDSTLTITVINDDCNMRSIAFSPTGYHRIKN
jgi:hypothetical protein